jgi:hypothetical protein
MSSLIICGDGLLEIDVNDRSKQLVHALLVGDIWVDFAPDEEHAGEQFEDVGVLEELHFLIGAIDVLLDLLVEEGV